MNFGGRGECVLGGHNHLVVTVFYALLGGAHCNGCSSLQSSHTMWILGLDGSKMFPIPDRKKLNINLQKVIAKHLHPTLHSPTGSTVFCRLFTDPVL